MKGTMLLPDLVRAKLCDASFSLGVFIIFVDLCCIVLDEKSCEVLIVFIKETRSKTLLVPVGCSPYQRTPLPLVFTAWICALLDEPLSSLCIIPDSSGPGFKLKASCRRQATLDPTSHP